MDKTTQERYNDSMNRDLERLSTAQRCIVDAMMGTIQTLDGPEREALIVEVSLLVKASARDRRKREADRANDGERRILIGARVRRSDAERYRDIAAATGRSVYRFVVDALQAEARACSSGVEWQPLVGSILPQSSPPGPSLDPQGEPPLPVA